MILTTVCLFGQAQAKERDFNFQYKFKLIKGNKHPVCQHMLKVYKGKFQHYWASGDVPSEVSELIRKYSLEDIHTSFSPSSPEFDAITWEMKDYVFSTPNIKQLHRPILFARIDVNNDGILDVLVKSSFSNSKAGEDIEIFQEDKFHYPSKPEIELLNKENSTPRIVGWLAKSVRPFIWKNTTYIHILWSEDRNGNVTYDPMAPIQSIKIIKVLDSGFGEDTKIQTLKSKIARTEETCRIDMTYIQPDQNNKK